MLWCVPFIVVWDLCEFLMVQYTRAYLSLWCEREKNKLTRSEPCLLHLIYRLSRFFGILLLWKMVLGSWTGNYVAVSSGLPESLTIFVQNLNVLLCRSCLTHVVSLHWTVLIPLLRGDCWLLELEVNGWLSDWIWVYWVGQDSLATSLKSLLSVKKFSFTGNISLNGRFLNELKTLLQNQSMEAEHFNFRKLIPYDGFIRIHFLCL